MGQARLPERKLGKVPREGKLDVGQVTNYIVIIDVFSNPRLSASSIPSIHLSESSPQQKAYLLPP